MISCESHSELLYQQKSYSPRLSRGERAAADPVSDIPQTSVSCHDDLKECACAIII